MINNTKVYLRALESEDYKKSIEWRNDAKIWDMVIGRRYFVSKDYEKKWVESASSNSSQLKLAICDKKNNNYIGNIYLNDIDFFNRSASFAILIGDDQYWGGGFGSEATMLILHHAFYDLGLERVESRQLLSNKGSIKLHEKCGFKHEGILRNYVFKAGKFQDVYNTPGKLDQKIVANKIE